MAMKINNKFSFEDKLYLVSDPEQQERICTCIIVTPNGLLYQLACGTEVSEHYEMEISPEKKII